MMMPPLSREVIDPPPRDLIAEIQGRLLQALNDKTWDEIEELVPALKDHVRYPRRFYVPGLGWFS